MSRPKKPPAPPAPTCCECGSAEKVYYHSLCSGKNYCADCWPPPAPPAPPAPWPLRMLVEEIATRIRSAMEEKNLSLFELAAKLGWAPARLLQWIDGSLANLPGLEVEEAEGGTLRELVDIGAALGKRWTEFQIGKGPMKGVGRP